MTWRVMRVSVMSHLWQPLVTGVLLMLLLAQGGCQSTVRIMEISAEDRTMIGEAVVMYSGQEGAVCLDGATDDDAQVLCRQAGYAKGENRLVVNARSSQISLTTPSCNGSETDIMLCPGSTWGDYTSQCSQQKILGVKCTKKAEPGLSPVKTIIYGVVGTVVLIGILVMWYFYMKHRAKKRSPMAEFARKAEAKRNQKVTPAVPSAQPSQLTNVYSTTNNYNTDFSK